MKCLTLNGPCETVGVVVLSCTFERVNFVIRFLCWVLWVILLIVVLMPMGINTSNFFVPPGGILGGN